MKSLVKAKASQGIWLEDVDKPTFGANDVLIKIVKTAICGTDLHIYQWDEWSQATIPVPMTIGHEFVGVVEDFGAEVKGFAKGDRVSGEGHITCGICRNCRAGTRHLCRNTLGIGVNRSGCFAEYLSMPACNVLKIPDDISDVEASILDPLGNAAHTALSFDVVGEDVLITGAGPIGIMACAIVKRIGARYVVVTDINEYRLALAKEAGATLTINAQKESLADAQKQLGMQEGFDVGLEMSGQKSAFNSMIENMNHGGRIALLGILSNQTAIDWNQVIFKGLNIKGIYGREMFETWYKVIAMLQSGLNIKPVITHEYDVSDFQKAFDMALSGQSGKVVMNW